MHPHLAEGGKDPVARGKGEGTSHLGRLLPEYGGIGADAPLTLQRDGALVEDAGEQHELVHAPDFFFRQLRHEIRVRFPALVQHAKALRLEFSDRL